MADRAKLIAGLREFAEVLEANPDLPLAYSPCSYHIPVTKEELPIVARAAGELQKEVSDSWFNVSRMFGGLRVEWYVARDQVCRRILKETKTLPAEPERTVTLPAKEEKVVEVFEWVCPDSILRPIDPPDADDLAAEAEAQQMAAEHDAGKPAANEAETTAF